MDKSTLFNMALSLIGGGDYTSDSGHARVCELWYPIVLREAACRCNWTFSRRKATLSRNADGTYTLPSDCMNILYLREGQQQPETLLIVGRHIYTSATSPLNLIYTSSDIADLQELPNESPEFCVGTAYLLAARIARTVAGDMSTADTCEQHAEIQFQKAVARDAQQEHSNKTAVTFANKRR